MAVQDQEVEFSFRSDGRERRFIGIRELGFTERGAFVVSAWTTPAVAPGEPRGSYFTSLPISPAAYRAAHPTRAEFERAGDTLVVRDDWGSRYVISAPSPVIEALAAECVANAIPPPSPSSEESER